MVAPEKPTAPVVVHRTRTERAERAKAARTAVPRASLGTFEPAADRPDPIALLSDQAATRIPELVPVRNARMAVSPFTFYRGAALVMATDLAPAPRTGFGVQACGDAHLSNFGGFATPERDLVFDINDFDETMPGPWEWDVKRLAASLEIAARDNGFKKAQRREIVEAAMRSYREAMRAFAGETMMQVWNARLNAQALLASFANTDKAAGKRAEQNLAKAHTRDSMQAFQKLTRIVDGQPEIVSSPPLVVALRDFAQSRQEEDLILDTIHGSLRRYRASLTTDRRHLLEQYKFVDLARKVVGVGSVGTRCWIALFVDADGDPLFLQVKQAEKSVLSPFIGASKYRNQGARVVAGQRLMQSASDIFLGWDRVDGVDGVQRDYYMRQLRDWKVSAIIELMTASVLAEYGKACAWVLAKAHARSGDRIAIGTYLGGGTTFDTALGAFAAAYADVNERDHAALLAAIKSGKVPSEPGV